MQEAVKGVCGKKKIFPKIETFFVSELIEDQKQKKKIFTWNWNGFGIRRPLHVAKYGLDHFLNLFQCEKQCLICILFVTLLPAFFCLNH